MPLPVLATALPFNSGMPPTPFRGTDSWWMYEALEAAGEGIVIESGERVVYANTSYAQLLGYRGSADLVRRSIGELIADCDAERLAQFGRLRISGKRVPTSYDFAALRMDGSSIRLQASVSVSISRGLAYIMTIARPFCGGIDTPIEGPIAGMHDVLSPRERQVMEMLVGGKRPKVIAFELGLTENTVATHRTRLLEKIGVSDNLELYQYALRHRLVAWP